MQLPPDTSEDKCLELGEALLWHGTLCSVGHQSLPQPVAPRPLMPHVESCLRTVGAD